MKQQLYCNCLAAALKSYESACSQTLGWSADPTKCRRNFGTCFSVARILPWKGLLWTSKPRKQFWICLFAKFEFFYSLKRSNLQVAGDTGLSHWQFPVWQIRAGSKQIKNSPRKHCQSLLSPKINKQKARPYGWAAIFIKKFWIFNLRCWGRSHKKTQTL